MTALHKLLSDVPDDPWLLDRMIADGISASWVEDPDATHVEVDVGLRLPRPVSCPYSFRGEPLASWEPYADPEATTVVVPSLR